MVTMALSSVVSEIFNVQKCRDLEIWVRGHSWSLKSPYFLISLWIHPSGRSAK